MTSKGKKIISVVISLIIILLLAHFLYENSGNFKEIKKIHKSTIAAITLLSLLSVYLNGLLLKISAIPFKIKLENHFSLSLATGFFNLITPFRAGAGIRAVYMKKKHNLNYTNFISTLLGSYIIILLVCSSFAIISTIVVYKKHQIFNIYPLIFFISVFLGSLILSLFPLRLKAKGIILKKIREISAGWAKISKNRTIIAKFTIITVAQFVIFTTMNQLIFNELQVKISFFQALYLTTMTTFSTFINITPGSIGITESIYFISSKILNINATIGLLAALIIRIINAAILLILGPIANYFILKDLKNITKNDPRQ